jgi:hypothetical protein
VIAPPPVWGLLSRRQSAVALAVYTLAVVAGALALAAVLDAAGHALRAPWAGVGAVALVAAIFAAEALPVQLPQSRWRVPREWGRLGPVGYAAAFGSALGLGVLTALPSPGFYVILYYGLTGASLVSIWIVAIAFAVGRALPMLAIAAATRRSGEYPAGPVELVARTLTAASPLEVLLLAAVAGAVLAPGG